jgi:NAD-dependent dihydropyrimidine dehydrogenase PreA subunit
VRPELCSGCGTCVQSCPTGAISLVWGIARIDQDRCNSCGICLEACPQGAIAETVPVSNQELVATVSSLRQRTDSLLERIERLQHRGQTGA